MAEDEENDYLTEVTTSSLPGWVRDLRVISRSPVAWVVSIIVGISVADASSRLDENSALEVIFNEYIYQRILYPAAASLYDSLIAIISSIQVIFLGGDKSIGQSGTETLGVADVPVVIGAFIGGTVLDVSGSIVAAVNTINREIASGLEPFGIAAPVVVGVAAVAELAALAWITWWLVSSIDFPLVRAEELLMEMVRPFINLIRWLT